MTTEEKISRNDFLKKMGFSGAALFALYTLDSCSNQSSSVTPAGTTITIDLTATPTPGRQKRKASDYHPTDGHDFANQPFGHDWRQYASLYGDDRPHHSQGRR